MLAHLFMHYSFMFSALMLWFLHHSLVSDIGNVFICLLIFLIVSWSDVRKLSITYLQSMTPSNVVTYAGTCYQS
jgi:hypothetical protein